MREILFRGKRTDTGEWVEGDLVQGVNDQKGHMFIWSENDESILGVVEFEVYPETVGQYTGLTDRNGTKIFEGDVVDILTENEELGVVEYEDGGFLVNADGFSVDFHTNINGTDLEIIGNIHDNPELMEGAGQV